MNEVELISHTQTGTSKEEFKREVRQLLNSSGIPKPHIVIRPLKKKYSSCSVNGRLTFDNSLLEKPLEFRREVVRRAAMQLRLSEAPRTSSALFKAFFGGLKSSSPA